MAYKIKIGGQEISLDKQVNPFIEIDWSKAAKFDFSQLDEMERENIFLIGFPIQNTNRLLAWFRFKFGFSLIKDKIRNFSSIEIFRRKIKLRIQEGQIIIQKIKEQKKYYKYILIDPAGLDPFNISLLKNFILSLKDSKHKVFLIGIVNQPKLDFKFID